MTAIGSFSAEAVITSLRRDPQARVVGVSSLPREWNASSPLLDAFHRVPAARDVLSYVGRVLDICETERVTHVLPLIDPEVDAFTRHQEAFSSRGITLCMAPAETVYISRDKWLVFEAFRDNPDIRPIPTWKIPPWKTWPFRCSPNRATVATARAWCGSTTGRTCATSARS